MKWNSLTNNKILNLNVKDTLLYVRIALELMNISQIVACHNWSNLEKKSKDFKI